MSTHTELQSGESEVQSLFFVLVVFFALHREKQRKGLSLLLLRAPELSHHQLAYDCIQIDTYNTLRKLPECRLDEICSNVCFVKNLYTYPIKVSHNTTHVVFGWFYNLTSFFKTTPCDDTCYSRINCHIFSFI